jgi:hypothetical protein
MDPFTDQRVYRIFEHRSCRRLFRRGDLTILNSKRHRGVVFLRVAGRAAAAVDVPPQPGEQSFRMNVYGG